MKKSQKLFFLTISVVVAIGFWFNQQRAEVLVPDPLTSPIAPPRARSADDGGEQRSFAAPASEQPKSPQKIAKTDSDLKVASAPSTAKSMQVDSIELTAGNFESDVLKCFSGEPCHLSEDPLELYRHFKTSQNNRALDQLISFLRSKLKEPEGRERYKETLKWMIEDFYPREEKQFQEAAFYNYAGDLSRSLELYLDLEKKAAHDPTLRSAPKLNIANTLYDLKRYQESLPYYKAALDSYESRAERSSAPSQNEMIKFIEDRIQDVEKKTDAG